jgi:hypothetical protein
MANFIGLADWLGDVTGHESQDGPADGRLHYAVREFPSRFGFFGSCQSMLQCGHCFASAVLSGLPQYGQGAVVPFASGLPE